MFTESQWRAVAWVEVLSYHSRSDWDGFHFWCVRKRIIGGAFAGGEFYLGWHEDGTEFRVIERISGLDFAAGKDKLETLREARETITEIGDYLPEVLANWTEKNVAVVAEWEERRAELEARKAIAAAKAEAKAAKSLKVGRRRQSIFAEANGKCHYCETPLELTGPWEVDHKMPKALGGSNERTNLVAACMPCNRSKRDKTDIEFLEILAQRTSA